MTFQRAQENAHDTGHDYRTGAAHLEHWGLHDRLLGLVRGALLDTRRRSLPQTVLEVGAGHGGFTEPVLAFGFSVTATEMSRASIAYLRERYQANRDFEVWFDPDGDFTCLGDRRFAVVMGVSVLHHIPEYLDALAIVTRDHLVPGGALVFVQDPLWYPTLSRFNLIFSRIAFWSWRLWKGNYRRGMRTSLRRIMRVYDVSNPSDTVEYHVVRQGVNQRAIERELARQFECVQIVPYWSTPSRTWQRIGEVFRRTNNFAVVAHGYQGVVS